MRHIIGAVLRQWRNEKGWSLRAAAESAGISAPYASQLENGRREPTLKALQRIATAYGHSVAELEAEIKRIAAHFNVQIHELDQQLEANQLSFEQVAATAEPGGGAPSPADSGEMLDARDQDTIAEFRSWLKQRATDVQGWLADAMKMTAERSKQQTLAERRVRAAASPGHLLLYLLPPYVIAANQWPPPPAQHPDFFELLRALISGKVFGGEGDGRSGLLRVDEELSRARWEAAGLPPDRFWLECRIELGEGTPIQPIVLECEIVGLAEAPRPPEGPVKLVWRMMPPQPPPSGGPRPDEHGPDEKPIGLVFDYRATARLEPESAWTDLVFAASYVYNRRTFVVPLRLIAEQLHKILSEAFLTSVARSAETLRAERARAELSGS